MGLCSHDCIADTHHQAKITARAITLEADVGYVHTVITHRSAATSLKS